MHSMTHVHSDATLKHQILEIRCEHRQKLPLTTGTSFRAYVTNSGRRFSNDCKCAVQSPTRLLYIITFRYVNHTRIPPLYIVLTSGQF